MRESFAFAVTILAVFLVGMAFGNFLKSPEVFFEEAQAREEKNVTRDISVTKTRLLAVDQEGEGVLTGLSVRSVPGDGRLLVDVDNLLFWIDTQQSIQTAKKVAENYLGRDVNDMDITYRITLDNGSVVGGPSAGAAFSVATIAALQNKTLKENVIITGTAEEDGTVGEVSGIVPKGEAAAEGGYTLLLVPEGLEEFEKYKRLEECESVGPMETCKIDYRKVRVDVENETGIEVEEVSNVEEALEYMVQD